MQCAHAIGASISVAVRSAVEQALHLLGTLECNPSLVAHLLSTKENQRWSANAAHTIDAKYNHVQLRQQSANAAQHH